MDYETFRESPVKVELKEFNTVADVLTLVKPLSIRKLESDDYMGLGKRVLKHYIFLSKRDVPRKKGDTENKWWRSVLVRLAAEVSSRRYETIVSVEALEAEHKRDCVFGIPPHDLAPQPDYWGRFLPNKNAPVATWLRWGELIGVEGIPVPEKKPVKEIHRIYSKEERKKLSDLCHEQETVYGALIKKRRSILAFYEYNDNEITPEDRKALDAIDPKINVEREKKIKLCADADRADVKVFISVEDLPPEPPMKAILMIRKKKETLKKFQVRALKKYFRSHCKDQPKWICSAETVEDLEDTCESYIKRGEMDHECRACPVKDAPDDVWLRWGEVAGFTINEKRGVEETPAPKKTPVSKTKKETKPHVKKEIKPKPAPKDVVSKGAPRTITKEKKPPTKKDKVGGKNRRPTTENYKSIGIHIIGRRGRYDAYERMG